MREVSELEALLSYVFNDNALLLRALTHASSEQEQDNETLEFIGDAFLQLAISELLIQRFPDSDEGALTQLRSLLVNRRALHFRGQDLQLARFVITGNAFKSPEELNRTAIISGAFEAVCGAIFLDAGYRTALKVITPLFSNEVAKLTADDHVAGQDLKTQFFNHCKQKYGIYPELHFREDTQAPDQIRFSVQILVGATQVSTGSGRNKKRAVHDALTRVTLSVLQHEGGSSGD